MDIRELYTKICDFPELETLEQATELTVLQWEFIMKLLDQKQEIKENIEARERAIEDVKKANGEYLKMMVEAGWFKQEKDVKN